MRNQHVTVGGRLGPGKARENTELLDEFAKIGDNKNVFIALKKTHKQKLSYRTCKDKGPELPGPLGGTADQQATGHRRPSCPSGPASALLSGALWPRDAVFKCGDVWRQKPQKWLWRWPLCYAHGQGLASA